MLLRVIVSAGCTRVDPFSFLAVTIAGWLNQRQQQVIEYLIEENRVLREQIGRRRLRFTDPRQQAEGESVLLYCQLGKMAVMELKLSWER